MRRVTARLASCAPPLVIALVTALTYAGSFDGAFVADDLPAVRGNELIRSLAPANLAAIFTSFDDANYVPLKVLSLAVDYRLWGPGPAGFHFTNLLLHVLSALLVHRILLRLELGALPALGVALLWAVHPLQVESVAWISERKNVLSGFFFFGAFVAYLAWSESGRAAHYVALLVLYALALLSKMNTVVLPAVCLAYEVTFRWRLRRRDWLASLPLFALGALVVWFNLDGNPVHGRRYHGGSAIVTGLTSAVMLMRYLRNTVLPTDLSWWYGRENLLRDSALDPVVLLSLLGLAAIAAATIWSIRTRRPAAFWLLWFGITLAPMLNLIPFPSLIQDRYMYLPLLGLLVLAANALQAAMRRGAPRWAIGSLAVAAILACAVLSFQRVEVFDTPESLRRDWEARRHR